MIDKVVPVNLIEDYTIDTGNKSNRSNPKLIRIDSLLTINSILGSNDYYPN